MTAPKLLLDSSFLVAVANLKDKHRAQAIAFASTDKRIRIVPEVALTEIMYLLQARVDRNTTLRFLSLLQNTNISVATLSNSDIPRVQSIMAKYPQFDFVDSCILAIAERENITRICTFDRRDFEAFKPTHCEYLELLP